MVTQVFDPNLLWPVAGAVIAGGLIGLEREFRSSPAGFRTHILVSLSSALLMIAAVHQIRWLTDTPADIIRIDPVRMAHGILTGIGFLCGGVIFREGFTVRGLTTAASLWSTSALGVLFGVGFFGLAALGTLATVLVLAGVRLTEALVPQRQYADLKVRYLAGSAVTLSDFRTFIASHAFDPQSIAIEMTPEGVEFITIAGGYREARAEALIASLRRDESVISYQCLPRRA